MPWASYEMQQTASGPASVAVGEACLECHSISEAFPDMTFSEVCAACDDAEFKARVDQAREVFHLPAGKSKPFQPNEVFQSEVTTGELSRTFNALNERELKKLLGVDRLTQAVIKDLPRIQLPSEDKPGQFEWIALFAGPPDLRFRQFKVTHQLSFCKNQYVLQAGDQLWDGQGQATFQHTDAEQKAARGDDALHNKLKRQEMLSISEYVEMVAPTVEASGGNSEADDQHAAASGSNPGLLASPSRPAAVLRQPAQSPKPALAPSASRPSPLSERRASAPTVRPLVQPPVPPMAPRSASAVDLAGAEVEEDSASVAQSLDTCGEVDVFDAATDGKTGAARLQV